MSVGELRGIVAARPVLASPPTGKRDSLAAAEGGVGEGPGLALAWVRCVWIEAVLLKEDLSLLVGQFAPVTIRLGDDGELHVEEPSDIAVVPGVGMRAVCKARLRWTVLGIAVPVTLNSLAILLRPTIAKRSGVEVLVFQLEIEHADFAGLPMGVDDRVTDLVNRELEAKHVELSWNYAATLNHVFDLSDALEPLERLRLTVGGARVKASEDAVALAIEFHADVLRREAGAAMPPGPSDHDRRGEPSPAGREIATRTEKHVRWPAPAIVGALAACALLGAYRLGRAKR